MKKNSLDFFDGRYTMKRRNVDNAKLRRTIKKSRIGDSMFSGGLIYVKLLMAWALLMMADFLLGFRFEYLWPFWLLIRSIYDSFRYQGLAFSVFFVCITVTSDLVCFLFIPVQWLFVLASTYVWLQYVWHADRGVCLPTVSLCLLFIYVEASVRLKELSSVKAAFPFTLDLCRPFAAHCIGYPVVTMGFGVKSYVGYKFRLRKQREIAKENDIHGQILAEALPSEWSGPGSIGLSPPVADSSERDIQRHRSTISEDVISNGALADCTAGALLPCSSGSSSLTSLKSQHGSRWGSSLGNGKLVDNSANWAQLDSLTDGSALGWFESLKQRLLGRSPTNWSPSSRSSGHGSDDDDEEMDSSRSSAVDGPTVATNSKRAFQRSKTNRRRTGGTPSGGVYHHQNTKDSSTVNVQTTYVYNQQHLNTVIDQQSGDTKEKVQDKDVTLSLESDVEKLKNDLRSSRMIETELRQQNQQLISTDKSVKNELHQCRHKSEQLENKLHNLVRSREQDKAAIQTLEKKLVEEQKQRVQSDQQLAQERKAKKAEEAKAATSNKSECAESCRTRRREVESELKQLRRDLRTREEQLSELENELQSLRQYKDAHNAEVLMSALSTMKEKTVHLEQSLSSENRLKQDLFMALGEAKRQLEVIQTQLMKKDMEIVELRHRLTAGDSPQGGPTLTPPPPAPMSNGAMMGHPVAGPNVDLLTSAMYSGVAAYLNNTLGGSVMSTNTASQMAPSVSGTELNYRFDENSAPEFTGSSTNRLLVNTTPPRTTN